MEGFKKGITVEDMVRAVRTGKIIERYRDRHRCLVSGHNPHGIPVHVVVDYRSTGWVTLVTTYIPQKAQWIKGQVRKRRKG